jgi:hypothetical protein
MASHSPEADAAPWRALFFEMLRKTGNVSAAARHKRHWQISVWTIRRPVMIWPIYALHWPAGGGFVLACCNSFLAGAFRG